MGLAPGAAAKLDNLENKDDVAISEYLRHVLNDHRDATAFFDCAKSILQAATLMTVPDEKLIRSFDLLVNLPNSHDLLSCSDVFQLIEEFTQFEKFPCLAALLRFLRSYLPRINCSHFDEMERCSHFLKSLIQLFKWFFTAFQNVMKSFQLEEDTTTKIALDILNTTNIYLEDPFIHKTMQITIQYKLDKYVDIAFGGMRSMTKMATVSSKISKEFERLQKNIELIHEPLKKLPLHYFNTIGGLQKRPGMRSLTAIFMGFRVLCPASEIAETIELVGTINDYGKNQIVVDILHACILILLEEFPHTSSTDPTKQDEMEKPYLDVYKLNMLNIFFKKFPEIFDILINRDFFSLSDVLVAIENVIRSFKQELDVLDFSLKANTIRLFLEYFVEKGKISNEMMEKTIQQRTDQIRQNSFLSEALVRAESENKVIPMLGFKSKSVFDKIKSSSPSRIDQMMREVIPRETSLFDALCSWFTVEGDILEWTKKLASLSRAAEEEFLKEHEGEPRMKNTKESLDTFGIYFMLLARISWYFPSLNLEEFVTGANGMDVKNLEGGYYKWTKNYVKRIIPKEEEAMNQETAKEEGEAKAEETMEIETESFPEYSDEMRQNCLNLGHRELFWNIETQSPMSLIEIVPSIGEVWLTEYKTKSLNISLVQELFYSLKEFPVMVLCLCQWLENQPYSSQRYILGKYLYEIITKWQEEFCKRSAPRVTTETLLWQLLWMQCKLHLNEISELPPFFHPMSVFQKSVANRTLPKCGRYEVAGVNMMKDAWIYCQRQNWFSVRPLVLVDHLNKSNNPRSWINSLFYNAIKLEMQDSVAKAIEMLTTITLLDPVRTTAKTIEVIIDLLLIRDPAKSPNKPSLMQMPECTMPIVQYAIQALTIGVWLVNRKNEDKEPMEKKRRRSSVDIDQPWKSLMTDDTDEIDILDAFITNAINCLISETLNGVLRPASSMIYHMLNLIARSPRNRFRDKLIKRIPQNMIFRLAVVDPHALPLEVFAEFCEPDQPSHSESLLQYLFLLRKCGGI